MRHVLTAITIVMMLGAGCLPGGDTSGPVDAGADGWACPITCEADEICVERDTGATCLERCGTSSDCQSGVCEHEYHEQMGGYVGRCVVRDG